MQLPFTVEAATELEAVTQFYERERRGYGSLLIAEARTVVALAHQHRKPGYWKDHLGGRN